MAEIRADILAGILLVQNMLGQLPDEASIIGFLCRGLKDVPGVLDARFVAEETQSSPTRELDSNFEHLTLARGEKKYGEIVLRIADPTAYRPYAPFIRNLSFMVSVILEERRQRALNEAHQRELESRVQERTAQLREEKLRAERYLEASEAIVVELDKEGRVILINKRGSDILGYPWQELIGKDWFDQVLPSECREEVRNIYFSVMKGNSPMSRYHDNEILVSSGGRRTFAWHNECRYSEAGEVIGTISSGIDITERKRVEISLSDEKERLAVTLRSIGDGVITTDVQGMVRIMNKAAEELTGWTNKEAFGQPLTEVFRIVNEETRQPCENPHDKVIHSGLIVELANHTILVSRDGSERPIADSAAPIKNSQSVTVGVVLVFRDMTEKYKLLADAQRNDRLNALGILAGGIAHDFNNLLAGLFGYISEAQRESSETMVLLNLEKALSVFNRTRDLTQQLLTFSKGGVPVKHIVDIRPVIRECTAFALSGTNITCHYDLAADLWPCDFDKNQIAQVIDNMVINARQAMPNGGSVLIAAANVLVEEKEHAVLAAGEYVKISISDTGIGIAPDKIHRIFDPFYTTKQSGNGLGLATCHSIVHKHDGAIDVESVVGKGTRFDIFLPAASHILLESTPAEQKRHRGLGMILVMDDEIYLREVMTMAFKSMGYKTIATKDGDEAIAAWEKARMEQVPIVAVFLDITIKGGMGGKETLQILRRLGSTVPIIATSGYSGDPIMSTPDEFGFTASIQKPFTVDELSELMSRHFG